jgi:carboxyl-terminal processing protease
MKPHRRGALLVLGVLVVSAVLGGIYGPPVRATAAGASDVQDSVRSFTRVLSVVQRNYAIPVDADRALYNGAIPAMLRLLDPHSNFFDPRQYALLREDQRGRYYGVGMTVGQNQEGRTVVLAPMPGSPASKAGIRPGDVIHMVEGKLMEGLTTSEVADTLKGPKGTVVRIGMLREGYTDPIPFTVTRDEIPKKSLDVSFMIRPGIGYVQLGTGFSEDTDTELANALRQLDANSLDGLILDLRNNPGGLLAEAVNISDMFLERNQLIVSHRGRSSPERRYYAVRGNRGLTVPLVVLVNGSSASASEIVSGAVQDHDRGLVVGEQTFGKGLVQTVSPLSQGTGLALTTARYYTPSGRLIQREYKDVSLYDYLSHNQRGDTPPTEVKLTDSGRQVFGGGGITPDVVVARPKPTPFQQLLLRRAFFYPYRGGVGSFTTYFLSTRPEVTKDFAVDTNVLAQFRRALDRENISFTETDVTENLDWIKRQIKKEVFLSVFGLSEGYQVELEDDPQVLKAIESIPQARSLYQNVRRVTAQRTGEAVPRR